MSRAAAVLLAVALTGAMAPAANGAVARTVRISVTTEGQQADGSLSLVGAISRHGRFVAFSSDATNLSGEDYRPAEHVYVRDRDIDADGKLDERRHTKTVRIDVSTNGVLGSGSTFDMPAISAGGRFVAFTSNSWNLIDGEFRLNNTSDIYVRDRDLDGDRIFDEPGAVKTAVVSVSSADEVSDYYSQGAAISRGGRYVGFMSLATNLVSGDTNLVEDLFIRDRDTDGDRSFDEPGEVRTTRLSVAPDGSEADGASGPGAFSNDGRYLTFTSVASNLVLGDTNGLWDVFVCDRDTDADGVFDEPGETSIARVSESSAGEEGSGSSTGGAISRTGRYVTFSSRSSNLVPGDTNGVDDAFVRDRDTDEDGIFDEPGAVSTTRVSVTSGGQQVTTAGSGSVSISGNGRFVGFGSLAWDLVPEDLYSHANAFVHDRDADRDRIFDEPGATATYRVGLTASGVGPSRGAYGPILSADGRWAAFSAEGTDLLPPDLYDNTEVYVRGPLPR